ncbi:unnamed protein product [Caenorhabditis nigoni]
MALSESLRRSKLTRTQKQNNVGVGDYRDDQGNSFFRRLKKNVEALLEKGPKKAIIDHHRSEEGIIDQFFLKLWPNVQVQVRKNVKRYRYKDKSTIGLEEIGDFADITQIPEECDILLYACAHNLNEIEPSRKELKKTSDMVKKRTFRLFRPDISGI